MYYTIGDSEQFWVERTRTPPLNRPNPAWPVPDACERVEVSGASEAEISDLFKNSCTADVESTFEYMFHKFKKGIYVKICNGELVSFAPFSKASYVNEWANRIQVDPKYGGLARFFEAHHSLSNKLNSTSYKFNPNKIQMDPAYWYANNCILRYENPINESDTNFSQLKSMFLELCQERCLPDIEFFLNKRDFPILTRNGTEPYNHIYGDNVRLNSHSAKYAPILSMCSSNKFADIAIPTHEDWARVKSQEDDVVFPPKCRNYSFKFKLDWSSKKNMAVFRGSNTGCGFNKENNTRLKLAHLSKQHPQYLDAGITNWNLRIRKHKDSPYLQIPDVGDLKLVRKLSPEQQSDYKYLINVDGHVSAFRLSLELSMGCCILLVDSSEGWKMWFSDLLEPYVHYVPVKADLSNLVEQVKWCVDHDAECRRIAKNALWLSKDQLTKKSILNYLQNTLSQLAKHITISHNEDPLLIQARHELEALSSHQTYALTGIFPQNVGRNYGVLKGLEKFVVRSINPNDQISLVGVEVKQLFQSRTTRVVVYQIGAKHVVAKFTGDGCDEGRSMKKLEFLHEAFIGKKVINNLVQICPNFIFTFSYREEPYIYKLDRGKEVTVLQEYVEGPTLQEFLKKCSFNAYMEVMLSLQCALQIGQNMAGFVHHDLKPWNIIVNILPEPVIIEYTVGLEVTYKLKTRYIPMIIDYGKSHVIFENVHYGIIDQFGFDKNKDLAMLIVSTLNELVGRGNLSEGDRRELLHMANFVSVEKLRDHRELVRFLDKAKKFGDGLTHIRAKPRDSFFQHVSSIIQTLKISFGRSQPSINTWLSNARQIEDEGFSLKLNEKIDSYLEVVRRIYQNPLPQATNRFMLLYIAQTLMEGIVAPKAEFIEFATRENIDKKRVRFVLARFQKMETFLTDFYKSQLNRKVREKITLNLDIPTTKTALFDRCLPSRSMFLRLDTTRRSIACAPPNVLSSQIPDYRHIRLIVSKVFRNSGSFKLEEEDRVFYMENLKPLFNDQTVTNIENIKTIQFYTRPSPP
jgi:serine/threonine protein kinase